MHWLSLSLYLSVDNENGAPVAAAVPDRGGHRQLECACPAGEADQRGADGAAGGAVARGHRSRDRDAIPEDARPCADDAALHPDDDRRDTSVAAAGAALGRVLGEEGGGLGGGVGVGLVEVVEVGLGDHTQL